MSRAVSPEVFAAKLEKWASAGFNYALVAAGRAALERDRQESIARAPSKTGALRRTIKVTESQLKSTIRRGFFKISLTAGSRAKGNPVTYASVLQFGGVGYPPKDRTRAHPIVASTKGVWHRPTLSRTTYSEGTGKMLKLPGGIFRRSVQHPGSHFRALHYLAISERRAAETVKASVAKSAQAEL